MDGKLQEELNKLIEISNEKKIIRTSTVAQLLYELKKIRKANMKKRLNIWKVKVLDWKLMIRRENHFWIPVKLRLHQKH